MNGWFQRFLKPRPLRVERTVRRESLSLTVPADHADAVRAGIERWFGDLGIATPLTSEDEGNGKTRLKAKLGEEDAKKLDLSDEGVQSKLQDVIEAAVSSGTSSS